MRPNDVEDAALPERGHLLRTSPAPLRRTETGTAFGARKSGMRAGLTPNAVQWCRCGGLRGPNLAECVAVRRRFRAKVGVFWQSLDNLISALSTQGQVSAVKAKRARVAAHVRTKATHAQWDEFEVEDVRATIEFTREFVAANLDV